MCACRFFESRFGAEQSIADGIEIIEEDVLG